MKEDRYWNFSRSERAAVIIMAAAIACIILFPVLQNKKLKTAETDGYGQEIDNFEKQLSERPSPQIKEKKNGKKEKKTVIYYPQEQSLAPKERETDK